MAIHLSSPDNVLLRTHTRTHAFIDRRLTAAVKRETNKQLKAKLDRVPDPKKSGTRRRVLFKQLDDENIEKREGERTKGPERCDTITKKGSEERVLPHRVNRSNYKSDAGTTKLLLTFTRLTYKRATRNGEGGPTTGLLKNDRAHKQENTRRKERTTCEGSKKRNTISWSKR